MKDGLSFDKRMPIRLKSNARKLNDELCYMEQYHAITRDAHKITITKTSMLTWVCGKTCKNKIRKERMKSYPGIAQIENNIKDN